MKKIGLTLLTAFIGGAMALGAYKLVENKYTAGMSFEDKQKVYLASNHYIPTGRMSASSGQPFSLSSPTIWTRPPGSSPEFCGA